MENLWCDLEVLRLILMDIWGNEARESYFQRQVINQVTKIPNIVSNLFKDTFSIKATDEQFFSKCQFIMQYCLFKNL